MRRASPSSSSSGVPGEISMQGRFDRVLQKVK